MSIAKAFIKHAGISSCVKREKKRTEANDKRNKLLDDLLYQIGVAERSHPTFSKCCPVCDKDIKAGNHAGQCPLGKAKEIAKRLSHLSFGD